MLLTKINGTVLRFRHVVKKGIDVGKNGQRHRENAWMSLYKPRKYWTALITPLSCLFVAEVLVHGLC